MRPLFLLALAGCVADTGQGALESPDSAPIPVELEQGSLEELEAAIAQRSAPGAQEDIQKALCWGPDDLVFTDLFTAMGMGEWNPGCPAWCQTGTVGGSIAIKSVSNQGSGDDLGLTGIELLCCDRW